MITQTGKLTYGVEVDGVVHTEFEMRLPTIADNIAAVEKVGLGSNLKVHVAMMAHTLVKLGTLPPENITYELLTSGLVDDDFDVLAAAEQTLKKKRRELNQPSPATDSASPSSAASEFPKTASVQ
jgi:hypothetical protein